MSIEVIIIPMLFDLLVLKNVLEECAQTSPGYDLDLRKNEKGAYDVVATWSKQPGKTEIRRVQADLEAQIKQKYACEKVKRELAKKGFILAEEEVQPDKTIRLVARKW